ncbi:MAG: type II toxin-antitoxin system Phd/YefM family antitoxin [Spirochaetales bacterium]
MKTVNTHEAKTHLSRILQEVSEGEIYIISRNGVPVTELRKREEKNDLPLIRSCRTRFCITILQKIWHTTSGVISIDYPRHVRDFVARSGRRKVTPGNP